MESVETVDAREEMFWNVRVFGTPALMSYARIDRDTIPKDWRCYELKGSVRDWRKPVGIALNVAENFAASVLVPSPLPKVDGTTVRRLSGKFENLWNKMDLNAFCERNGIPVPEDNRKYLSRPVSPEEAGLFYAMDEDQAVKAGRIGHVRCHFGDIVDSEQELRHEWIPSGKPEWNTEEFRSELDGMMEELRTGPLKSMKRMAHYCVRHGGRLNPSQFTNQYGYIVETERRLYCLRCNLSRGDYNLIVTCFDKRERDRAMETPPKETPSMEPSPRNAVSKESTINSSQKSADRKKRGRPAR